MELSNKGDFDVNTLQANFEERTFNAVEEEVPKPR